MIRPLEYCESTAHINTSLDTIDKRIKDLIALKEEYMKKKMILANKEKGMGNKDTQSNRLKRNKHDK